MTHGDPENPKQNPHPVERYEVIATTEAPGAWDAVRGYLEYQVNNPECTPEGKFLGVHTMPRIVGHDFEMIRMDTRTWKGYFYPDFMQDANYYGLGICHWRPSSISAVFMAHGVAFGSGSVLEDFLRNGPQTTYFKRDDFEKGERGDPALTRYGAPNYSAARPEYGKNPADFFPITVTVKAVTP